jgi:hypothetical protein
MKILAILNQFHSFLEFKFYSFNFNLIFVIFWTKWFHWNLIELDDDGSGGWFFWVKFPLCGRVCFSFFLTRPTRVTKREEQVREKVLTRVVKLVKRCALCRHLWFISICSVIHSACKLNGPSTRETRCYSTFLHLAFELMSSPPGGTWKRIWRMCLKTLRSAAYLLVGNGKLEIISRLLCFFLERICWFLWPGAVAPPAPLGAHEGTASQFPLLFNQTKKWNEQKKNPTALSVMIIETSGHRLSQASYKHFLFKKLFEILILIHFNHKMG